MGSELDALSNDELRVRLLEYGFANMPVTQTTRKVLIKKLKIAMESEKSKTRRETIAVTKYSSGEEDEEVKKPSRRTTMGVPTRAPGSPGRPRKPSVDRPAPPKKPEEISPPRRSSRQPVLKTAYVELDSDSDEEARDTRRKSKSPSLTRSKTITTSYKNDKAIAIAEEEEVDAEEPAEEYKKPRRPSPARPGLERTENIRKRAPLSKTTFDPVSVGESLTSPKYTRPSFSTSYNTYTSPTASRYSATAAPADSNGTLSDSFDPDYQSPYLSDFTRRLSKLQAEPLTPPIKAAIPRGTGVYYRTGKNSQVLNAPPSDGISESLAPYKATLAAVGVFLVLLFLFVMFYL